MVKRHSVFSIWALAFGCVIGWGCFVMPGTTFLPDAGPVGTMIGIAVASAMILVVAWNYSILARRYPKAEGSYGYSQILLGNDYAFLTAWSLVISYLMLLWANSTAFVLIGRYFIGDVMQFGLHYTIAGYDVYLGEVLVTIVVELVFALLIAYAPRAVFVLRVVLGAVLFGAVCLLFFGMLVKEGFSFPLPHFSSGEAAPVQVISVAVLAPWMFVGFETVYHVSGWQVDGNDSEEGFSVKSIVTGAVLSVIAGMLVYAFLALIAVSAVPEGCDSWIDYVSGLGNYSGIDAVPVFYNIRRLFGSFGVVVAAIAVFCALATGVLGFFQSASGLIGTMARDKLLPASFAEEVNGVPRRAVLTIMVMSLPVPFLGRTSIGWLVDVSTLAVAVVYAQISMCVARVSEESGHVEGKVLGFLGAISSVGAFVFLLIPNIFSQNALTVETYFMMALWSFTGIVYYWFIFRRDTEHRYGKSTVMWILLLTLLFISAILWISLDTQMSAPGLSTDQLSRLLTRNSILEVGLIAVGIVLIISLFSTMLRREKEIDLERLRAEESDRAKSTFLFNMSHDIRTPMNAIIGYTTLALKEEGAPPAIAEYLSKIDASSHHLLALINDILEMSRIESGRIELEPSPADLVQICHEMEDLFRTQMEAKHIAFLVDVSSVQDRFVLCDKNRFNRILLNLLSNACKFTPDGGRVSVTVRQLEAGAGTRAAAGTGGGSGTGAKSGPEGIGLYELHVKDNGIGMSREFAAKVFEAFERERTSTVNDIEGTGLGMAITRSLVLLMGGTIDVVTAPNEGTEFIVRVSFPKSDRASFDAVRDMKEDSAEEEMDFSHYHLLLTEDNEINREIAVTLLTSIGFSLETAENGREAVEKVAASAPGHFDLVLMDIQMPVMNGYEAARAIRALTDSRLSRIPILAMTANAFAEDVQAAREAGMDGHIAKPIDMEKMLETIVGVL